MDIGQPESKRPRTLPPGPSQPQWHPSSNAAPPLDNSRHLPPPPAFSQPHQSSPFQRPPEHAAPRRLSTHTDHPYYEAQDPRRPPSRPSHGYQPPHNGPQSQLSPFNGQREHASREHPAPVQMIKRDPSEDHAQYGRSPSNPVDHGGNHHAYASQPLDGNRPYHHQQQQQQQQHGLPHYESPHPHPPPSRNNSNSYPPPSPVNMAAPDQYAQYQRPSTHGEPYATLAYPQASTPRANEVKRKAQRAAQACDSCRTLKAKCDEGRPSCGTCKEKQVECNYRDPPPKQPDKSSADVLDAIQRLGSQVDGVRAESLTFNATVTNRLNKTDNMLEAILRSLERPPPDFRSVNGAPMSQIPPSPAPYTRLAIAPDGPYLRRETSGLLEEQSLQPEELVVPAPQDDGSEDDDNAEPRAQKLPTIPVDHTTGAARLLTAPGIKEHLADIIGPGKKIKNERYPMILEEKRGSLRIFGRGEGTEATPGYERDGAQENVLEDTPNDARSDTSSPAPFPGEEFGQLGGLTPPAPLGTQEFVRGGIASDGMPDFSKETVWELVRSYKDNINNMHPLLAPKQLDIMVELFLRQIPEAQAKPKHSLFVGGGRIPDSPGNKRKRSPIPGEHYESHPHTTPSPWEQRKPGHPFRSITSAIVLLVLALGKICLHRGKLPDVSREAHDPVSSPVVRNGHPYSPIQQSPTAMSGPSPGEIPARSRRTSLEASVFPGKDRVRPKNIDLIPGLAYFAFATDVIGNQLGGNKLQHVHANLLAGLYHGQLGRVIESHAYIHQACYNLESILRKKFSRYRKTGQSNLSLSPKDNQIVFAFWTCLTLESDIIAELPVPSSNILTYEEDMPTPALTVATDDGFDPLIVESYSAQLYLRKHLNLIHRMFYRPNLEFSQIHERNPNKSYTTLDAIEDGVNPISMSVIAPNMGWNTEAGERSPNILHARLRAKYYGAMVITYRPFILKILEASRPNMARDKKDATGLEKEWKAEIGAPVVNEDATSIHDIEPKVQEYARKGIKALIHSTCAFYDVVDCGKQRLLVTNVWGTAHAQWGNLMTLQACYLDKILSPLVTEAISPGELSELIRKTSSFLNFIATRTSALASDNLILRHMAKKAGLWIENERGSLSGSGGSWKGPESNGGSFTSVNSAHSSTAPELPMTGYQS